MLAQENHLAVQVGSLGVGNTHWHDGRASRYRETLLAVVGRVMGSAERILVHAQVHFPQDGPAPKASRIKVACARPSRRRQRRSVERYVRYRVPGKLTDLAELKLEDPFRG